jgi:hypothetical protein
MIKVKFIFTDDVNLLGENVNTINESAEAVLDA